MNSINICDTIIVVCLDIFREPARSSAGRRSRDFASRSRYRATGSPEPIQGYPNIHLTKGQAEPAELSTSPPRRH